MNIVVNLIFIILALKVVLILLSDLQMRDLFLCPGCLLLLLDMRMRSELYLLMQSLKRVQTNCDTITIF